MYPFDFHVSIQLSDKFYSIWLVVRMLVNRMSRAEVCSYRCNVFNKEKETFKKKENVRLNDG